jgi:hypothetical protein
MRTESGIATSETMRNAHKHLYTGQDSKTWHLDQPL